MGHILTAKLTFQSMMAASTLPGGTVPGLELNPVPCLDMAWEGVELKLPLVPRCQCDKTNTYYSISFGPVWFVDIVFYCYVSCPVLNNNFFICKTAFFQYLSNWALLTAANSYFFILDCNGNSSLALF